MPWSSAKPDAEVEAASLIAFCKERIAGYKCPRSVDIRDEPLPLSGAGKDTEARTAQAVLGKPPAHGELKLVLRSSDA